MLSAKWQPYCFGLHVSKENRATICDKEDKDLHDLP